MLQTKPNFYCTALTVATTRQASQPVMLQKEPPPLHRSRVSEFYRMFNYFDCNLFSSNYPNLVAVMWENPRRDDMCSPDRGTEEQPAAKFMSSQLWPTSTGLPEILGNLLYFEDGFISSRLDPVWGLINNLLGWQMADLRTGLIRIFTSSAPSSSFLFWSRYLLHPPPPVPRIISTQIQSGRQSQGQWLPISNLKGKLNANVKY